MTDSTSSSASVPPAPSGDDSGLPGDTVAGDKIVTQTAGGDIVGRDKITTIVTDDSSHDVAGLPNLYLGLRNFTYADRIRYAGRESSTADAVAKLTQPGERQRLLFITGASGSGKSSFAQASVLPALEAYYAQRVAQVQHAILRPGRHPMAALQDALQALQAKAAGVSSPAIRVLAIDQFEEVFTQSAALERDALFRWLSELPNLPAAPEYVVCTLRSDYLNELFEVGLLWERAKQGIELRAMNSGELKVAILRPLQSEYPRGEKRMEPALVDRLAQDAAGQSTYLPLLQVTLEELWNKGRLVLSAYTTLSNAIKQRANVVYDYVDYNTAAPRQRRSPAEQAAILELCLSLVSVSPDDDPRRDVRVGRPTAELTAQQRRLAADLSQARLLSIDNAGGVETVNVIHETLIANWDRLRLAVQAQRHQLRQRGRFEQQLQLWLANDCSDDYLLLTTVQLGEASQLDAAADIALRSPRAGEFLRRSLDHAQQARQRELEEARKLANSERQRAEGQAQANRRLRARNLVISVVGVLALAAAAIAALLGVQSNQSAAAANLSRATAQAEATRAEQARATAVGAEQLAEARLLLTQGQSLYPANPVLGVRLALEAMALLPDSDTSARPAIVDAVRSLLAPGRLYRLGDDIRQLYPAGDHNFMVVTRGNGPDELRRASDANWRITLPAKVSAVTYSSDAASGVVLITYSDAPGELRRTSDGSLVAQLSGKVGKAENTFFGARFSPGTAASVVVNYLDATAELRRASDGTVLARLNDAAFVEFSPDPNGQDLVVGKLHYASATSDQYGGLDIDLYRTADGARLLALPGVVTQDGPNSIGLIFSQDVAATSFVVRYANALSELRRTTDGALLATLAAPVDAVTFSSAPTPSYVVTSYFTQPAELRRATDGSVITTLGLNPSASFSPDGTFLVVGPVGQAGELRRSADGTIVAQLTSELAGSINDPQVTFGPTSPTGLFFTHYIKGAPELRRLPDGALVSLTGSPLEVRFSPDDSQRYFYVSYGAIDQPADEVRRTADGTLVAKLPAGVQFSTFIPTPQGGDLALYYRGSQHPDELRRVSDGALLATLPDKLTPDGILLNPGPDHVDFVVGYSNAHAEIRQTSDGRATALSGQLQTDSSRASYSPPDGRFLLLSYDDGTSEIWATLPSPHRLVDLGRGLADGFFEANSRRIVVRYKDGQVYGLSLDLLDALDGHPATLAPDSLRQIACRLLFAAGKFDEAQLVDYLAGHPSVACQ